MDKFQRNKKFLNQPKYPGGRTAMQEFIVKNLVYPPRAIANKTEGTVTIKYTIKKGEVVDAKVIAKVGDGCDEEAQRLVSLLKFEMPKNRGLKALFHRSLNINFRLPKKKTRPKEEPKPSQKEVLYHLIPSKKQGRSYGYTVEV